MRKVATFLAVAFVATALAYVNLIMQPGLTTYLGGSANSRYTQGWPFVYRSLVIQEPDPTVVRNPKVETKILDSDLSLRFLFLNLLVCLTLCTAVFFVHAIRGRNTSRILQLDLTALFFATTISALLAWQTSVNYRFECDLADWFPNQLTDPIDLRSCLPNLFTFLPIVYSLICVGFVVLISLSFLIAPRKQPPIVG